MPMCVTGEHVQLPPKEQQHATGKDGKDHLRAGWGALSPAVHHRYSFAGEQTSACTLSNHNLGNHMMPMHTQQKVVVLLMAHEWCCMDDCTTLL